jgi:hypothetical protein
MGCDFFKQCLFEGDIEHLKVGLVKRCLICICAIPSNVEFLEDIVTNLALHISNSADAA